MSIELALYKHEMARVLREKNVELERLSRAKSQFATMVAHDLRTPLAILKSDMELLQQGATGPLSVAQRECLTVALYNIGRLDRLISNILHSSSFEAGQLQLHRARVDLGAMLHSVYDTLRPYLQRRGLTLQLYLPEEPVVVQCDAERLQQVVINLVENAMKYARDQGTVQLALARHAEHVEFSVTDDGPGIVSEEFATLFEMFQRGRPVDLFNTPGFGVGLAVCRCIVEAHGGEVIPENRPGTGARFTVRLPLQSPSAGANAAPPAQTVAQ